MKREQTGTAGQLVAVVVTYNRVAQLQTTLATLLSEPPEILAAVVVIDNASTDGTQDWLSGQTDPRLDVFRSETNRGGAGGFEQGLRRAVTRFDPDWVVVMDDDARPQPGALAQFHTSDLTGVDGVAAAVYHPDGRICDMNRPWRNPFWHGRVFWKTLRKRRDGFHMAAEDYAAQDAHPIDGASFVGLFLSRDILARSGWPDPTLFIYGDDVLYTLRMSAAGARLQFDPRITFSHDFTTLQDGVQRFRPLWKCYYHHRNLLMIYREASGLFFFPCVLPLVLLKWRLKARHYGADRAAFLRIMRRAVRDGLWRDTSAIHAEIVALSGEN